MNEQYQKIRFVYSCDVNRLVKVKVGSLEGHFPKPSVRSLLEEERSTSQCVALQDRIVHNIYLHCQIFCNGRPFGLPVHTSFKSFTLRYNWNEWLVLPIKYCDLSRDAFLAFTILDVHANLESHVLGGTSISLFTKRGILRQRMYDLKVWPYVSGDGQLHSVTPGKVRSCQPESASESNDFRKSRVDRVSKLSKLYFGGMVEKIDWLDRITFRQVETIFANERDSQCEQFLLVEFPVVRFGDIDGYMVYFEPNGGSVCYFNPYPAIGRYPDSELGMDNLVEAKHHVLARCSRSLFADREIKPNATTRDLLAKIVNYSPNKLLNGEEKDLVWKFRYYLKGNQKALAKFLQCVHWGVAGEVEQAEDLLNQWVPMSVDDALELLSSNFSHPTVRHYAVGRLKEASYEVLMLYLLQLVQALKFEPVEEISGGVDSTFVQGISRISLDNDLNDPVTPVQGDAAEVNIAMDHSVVSPPDLATFLISAACKDTALANYLYWYLKVERDCSVSSALQKATSTSQGHNNATTGKEIYAIMLERLSRALARGGSEARRRRKLLRKQQLFVDAIVQIMRAVVKESGNRKHKTEYLRWLLNQSDDKVSLTNLAGLPLPLDPSVRIQMVVADEATIFNSALAPCKLTFRTLDGQSYTTIFKYGDDLRQDQLIIQMVTLMDKLLRQENLDLRLTPYKVLSTSINHGFVQYIESDTLRDVLRDYSTIQDFFRTHRPSPGGPFGIEAEVMDNYVRSCAGYSVISYLLGIGDRHLHNLLLCKNGRLFHVDFGYILGRDPRILPPPVKLTKEMIEGMGGFSGPYWQDFRNLAYTAFLHLRRHANLFLNLFALMVNSTIPDIALEPDKAVRKLQERFLLHLTDEEAVQYMQQLIDVSISAKMAAIVDMMHDVAQYLRK
uniref:Phosphatidylinositol 3-kinase catalytic subunit type 3 n=1 Tax=Trichuris muris TaxID=70415 RepID=A0A5S6Q949_TRIMR